MDSGGGYQESLEEVDSRGRYPKSLDEVNSGGGHQKSLEEVDSGGYQESLEERGGLQRRISRATGGRGL